MHRLLLAALLFLQTTVQSNNGTVTGRIMSEGGGPAVGVRVTAKPLEDSSATISGNVLVSLAQTDAAGRYRIENIPPGRYFITAGLVAAPTYFPGTMAIGEAKAISITTGKILDMPDFTLQQIRLSPAEVFNLTGASSSQPKFDVLFARFRKLATPITIDVDQDARKSYEDIGKLAGIQFLFDRRFVAGTHAQFKVQNVAAIDALLTLSTQTGNSLLPLDTDTMIVMPAGAGAPGLDLQFPPHDLSSSAIYPGFHPQPAYPLAFNINALGNDAFETVAHAAGLNVIFDRDSRLGRSPVQLKLDNADIYSALNILSAQLRTFWMPVNGNTIFVTDDNATKHRDYDLRMIKTFYLSNLKTSQEINNATAEVRRTLSPKGIFSLPGMQAIVVTDTPQTVALAEAAIAALDQAPTVRGDSAILDAAGNLFLLENGALRNVTPYRSRLQPNTGSRTLNGNDRTAVVYEKLATAAGVKVVFNPDLRFTPSITALKLNGVEFFAALDLLSLQTRTFWVPLDSKTVFVSDENSTLHRDYDLQIVKGWYLNSSSSQELDDMANLLRQAVPLSLAYVYAPANAIVIRDTPKNVALAEILLSQLQRNKPGAVPAAAHPALELETDSVGRVFAMTPPHSLLQPAVLNSITIQTNEDGRAAYQALARLAGLQVQFDSRFSPRNAVDFQVENANLFDALNLLALQTKSFWQVVDAKTIMVAPATPSIRQELEPQIQKTIRLSNVVSETNINALALAVGGMILSRAAVTPNVEMNAIEVRTTASNMEVAERLVHALDLP